MPLISDLFQIISATSNKWLPALTKSSLKTPFYPLMALDRKLLCGIYKTYSYKYSLRTNFSTDLSSAKIFSNGSVIITERINAKLVAIHSQMHHTHNSRVTKIWMKIYRVSHKKCLCLRDYPRESIEDMNLYLLNII